MNTLLGIRIKELRIAKQLTQEQVADQIGISQQKYARIESGINSVTLEMLTQIESLFDVTVGDITKVLGEEPVMAYKMEDSFTSSQKILDMLDFFYANKHLYEKIRQDTEV